MKYLKSEKKVFLHSKMRNHIQDRIAKSQIEYAILSQFHF